MYVYVYYFDRVSRAVRYRMKACTVCIQSALNVHNNITTAVEANVWRMCTTPDHVYTSVKKKTSSSIANKLVIITENGNALHCWWWSPVYGVRIKANDATHKGTVCNNLFYVAYTYVSNTYIPYQPFVSGCMRNELYWLLEAALKDWDELLVRRRDLTWAP